MPGVSIERKKHTATKKFTKKVVDRRQSARLKASIDPNSEATEKVDISTDDSESSSKAVTEKVVAPQKTKKFATKSVPPASATTLKTAVPTSSKVSEKTQSKVPTAKK